MSIFTLYVTVLTSFQENDPHIHTFTLSQNFSTFFHKTSTSLSTQIQVENESSKYYWIKTKQKHVSHKHVINRQKMGFQGTKVRKANIAK